MQITKFIIFPLIIIEAAAGKTLSAVSRCAFSKKVCPPPDDEKNDDGIRYPNKIYKKITNSNGEIICEYYYNPSLYADIRFTDSADDKMPVTLISLKSHYEALDIIQTVQSALYALIALDFIVAAGVYSIKIHKNTQKAAESVN